MSSRNSCREFRAAGTYANRHRVQAASIIRVTDQTNADGYYTASNLLPPKTPYCSVHRLQDALLRAWERWPIRHFPFQHFADQQDFRLVDARARARRGFRPASLCISDAPGVELAREDSSSSAEPVHTSPSSTRQQELSPILMSNNIYIK